MNTKANKADGAQTAKALSGPKVAVVAAFEIYEQVNLRWRHRAKAGVTTEDLQHGDYLGGIAGRLSDFDLVDVASEDGRYWQCLVIQGGRDGATRTGGISGRARMIALPGYPIQLPQVDRTVNGGLPDGYSIGFDNFRLRHLPMWGDVPLSADGVARYEDARDTVLHHAEKSVSQVPQR